MRTIVKREFVKQVEQLISHYAHVQDAESHKLDPVIDHLRAAIDELHRRERLSLKTPEDRRKDDRSAVRVTFEDDAGLASSWQRCREMYRLDPASSHAPFVLSGGELKHQIEALAALSAISQTAMSRLHSMVGQLGYTVLLASPDGVIVDHRGAPGQEEAQRRMGLCVGGLWSEAMEGTNGVGTAIIEQRPLTVHRTQHFRRSHANFSCSAAPIFDPSGRLAAVLDVTSADPSISERAHLMALAVTIETARALEEELFRDCHRQDWIVSFTSPDAMGRPLLLAVDTHDRVQAADRTARRILSIDDAAIAAGLDLSDILARSSAASRRANGDAVEPGWQVLFTPPAEKAPSAPPDISDTPTGARDRAGAASPRRGGLPQRSLRRVREHIAQHLEEEIRLATLAEIAGLSVYHFAKAFREAVGVPPYRYILEARIARGRELLRTTQMTVMQIALATGFSDQSQFARQFRRATGVTPTAYRRAEG